MIRKTSTPLEQTSRLLNLVPFLLTHQGIPLADLAKQFAVTQDVILDDLNTLWMCGLPGYTPLELIDLEFDSGYVTIRNADPLAKVRALDSSEMVALALGLDLLLNSSGHLPLQISERIKNLAQRVRAVIGSQISITEAAQSQVRAIIDRAIIQRAGLVIQYFSPKKDELTNRTITPFAFFSEGSYEYVEAFCQIANAPRTFRLDRISMASEEFLPHVVSVSDEVAKTSIVTMARLLRGERSTVEALGLLSSEVTVGQPLPLSAYSADWLIRTTLGSSGDLLIESPVDIRRSIVESAQTTLALYEEGAVTLA